MQRYFEKKGFLFSMMPFSLNLLLMAILVYGHSLILIPRFLEKRRVVLYIFGVSLLAFLYALSESFREQYWDSLAWPEEIRTISYYFKWNAIYSLWYLLVSTLLYYTQKWSEQRQQVKNIQIIQLQTELKYLRAQINPHFLFNGLNTIYGTIDINNQQAREMVVQFSDLLRYNLYEADTDWVDLEKEAIYIENYVAMQKARSDNNLKIELDIRVSDKSFKIAPLIFLAFVENTFKHSTRDLTINNINIHLHQSNNKIIFECRNSYEEQAKDQKGIGLINVTRRLELLYKGCYSLEVKKENGIYETRLTINS
jgi:two-component system, LytTR family, sensor kinase